MPEAIKLPDNIPTVSKIIMAGNVPFMPLTILPSISDQLCPRRKLLMPEMEAAIISSSGIGILNTTVPENRRMMVMVNSAIQSKNDGRFFFMIV